MVELIDRPTWLAMRRLTTGGMITMPAGNSRVLHRSPEFAAKEPASDPRARAAELRADAQRSLRMARVLAEGGFPEEALPLVAKAIGLGAAARLAMLGELPAGATSATPAQIRHLVNRGFLAPQAQTALSGLWSAADAEAVRNVGTLQDMGALIIAGLDDSAVAVAA